MNGAALLCAALSAAFMRDLNGAGVLAAALINYALLARALCGALWFYRAVFIPYRQIIAFSLVVFLDKFKATTSIALSIRETI